MKTMALAFIPAFSLYVGDVPSKSIIQTASR